MGKTSFYTLMKKNYKIGTQIYKIQILNIYKGIISISYTF